MDSENSKQSYGLYHVGFKILLKKDDTFLFLRDTGLDLLDIPGGRIDENESTTPILSILKREIREELGTDVTYELGPLLFQFRRQVKSKGFNIFLSVYAAKYQSGKIVLSEEHKHFEWLSPREFLAHEKDFGEEEYFAYKNYFSTHSST